MKINKLTILFVISTSRINKKGLAPLVCRLTYHNKRKQYSYFHILLVKCCKHAQGQLNQLNHVPDVVKTCTGPTKPANFIEIPSKTCAGPTKPTKSWFGGDMETIMAVEKNIRQVHTTSSQVLQTCAGPTKPANSYTYCIQNMHRANQTS